MKVNNKYKKKISCKKFNKFTIFVTYRSTDHLAVPFPGRFRAKTVLNTVLLLQDFWLIKHFMWCPTTFMNKYIYILIYKIQMNENCVENYKLCMPYKAKQRKT